ncbi:MAG TPA: FliG C-terminal domain-containing protein [Opitutales bacterium]|nr:FliG C-terminal domain-containing protein [Opitutales bacterium]
MELLGPVRLREVEAAQDKIIMIVRKLEEDGEITIDQEGADRVLV